MSFLPSFSSLGAPSSSAATSTAARPTFKPASLSYFTIFCPALKPPKTKRPPSPQSAQHHEEAEEQDPDAREAEREAAQILFYTSRARAALKDRMLRQIGIAKGMIEFCAMVHPSADEVAAAKGRSWNVHSSKRRMVLLEVEAGVWVHASIDLPCTTRPPPSSDTHAKPIRDYHDELLPDAWLEECIRRAWRDWTLLNGGPAHILSQKAGRAGLERSLEKYFSVWAWSWDLEAATNAESTQQRSLFSECIEAFPVVPRGPRARLYELMRSEAAQRLVKGDEGGRELIVLSDTAILWPPSDAGCFDLDSRKEVEASAGCGEHRIDARTRAELLRRVVSHLTGLERERDLMRAAAVASTSDGRRRGTSGAIRERGSSQANTKRDVRTGLLSAGAGAGTGTGKKRVVSSPVMQHRSTSASSFGSSSTESTRWSQWGGMLSGLGKLGFRSTADSPARAETPEPKPSAAEARPEEATSAISIDPSTRVADERDGLAGAPSPTRVESADQGGEVSSPLSSLQDAGGKVWNGAELALRGLGASLGLAAASAPTEKERAATSDGDEVSEQERFADASFDTSTADADASVVTKVSILEPEVDVSELAEALGAEAADVAAEPEAQRNEEVDSPVEPDEAAREARSHDSETTRDSERVESDAASVVTSASAKAFPSISVTSAAWYNSKAVRTEAMVSTSPAQLPSAGWAEASEVGDTSLGGMSVQSEHHDFELDGWGHEAAQEFQSFKVYVGTRDEALSHESVSRLQTDAFGCVEYRVLFTTRRLLTFVVIERTTMKNDSKLLVEERDGGMVEDAWVLLRRMQRMLNDHARTAETRCDDERSGVRVLHMDGATLTMHTSLDDDDGDKKLEDEVEVVADAHCIRALELMRRHGVVESFSRSSNGKTWTASRQGRSRYRDSNTDDANQTFMVLAGRKASIVDCDTELRKLARQYPSFGI